MAVLAFAGAEAAHCTTWSTSGTNIERRVVVVEIGELAHPFEYIVIELCGGGLDWCPRGILSYYERNGLPGLQRNDDIGDDTCHGMIQADGFVAG